jgi:hypothetical protein
LSTTTDNSLLNFTWSMSSRKGKEVAADTGSEEQYDQAAYAPSEYYGASSSLSVPESGNQPIRKSKTIKSEGQITLQGPLDIVGSVKSGSNITFNGDFMVKEKIEAYGAIDINGQLTCRQVSYIRSFRTLTHTLSQWED